MKKTKDKLLLRKGEIEKKLNNIGFDKQSVEHRILLLRELSFIFDELERDGKEEKIERYRKKLIDDDPTEPETGLGVIPHFLLGYAIAQGKLPAFMLMTLTFAILASEKTNTHNNK